MGRIDAWDELSVFGIWDELSLGTNRRLGRIVAWDELSSNLAIKTSKKQTVPPKVLQRMFVSRLQIL